MGIPDGSRESNDRTWRLQEKLFPDYAILSLANAMDLIENDTLDTRGP